MMGRRILREEISDAPGEHDPEAASVSNVALPQLPVNAVEASMQDDHRSLAHAVGPARRDGCGVYLIEQPIPYAGFDRGDLVVYAEGPAQRPTYVRGRARDLTLDDYESLRLAHENRGDDLFTEIVPPGTDWLQLERFLTDRRRWGRRMKNWRSKLIHVRPFHSMVSDPIEAASDAGAIFELVAAAGGRLTRED